MTLRITITFIFALSLIASCTSKRNSEPDFDKTVMQEIFPSLLDSLYVEITFSMTPPKITEVIDSITGKTELKPVEKSAVDREKIVNDLSSCDRDSNHIIIVLSDSIHALYNNDLETFRSKYPLSRDTIDKSGFQKSYLISLNDLTVRNCFKLKLSSEYKPTSNDSVQFVRQLKEVSFSRIIFDTDKTQGMLTCEYICGRLCGNGYRVYIKKEKEKWIIQCIEHSWMS